MTSRPLPTDPQAMAWLARSVRPVGRWRGGDAWLAFRLRARRAPLTILFISALLGLPLCIGCALLLDVPVARLASLAPPGLKRVAELASDLGLSGYMLVVSALVAGAAQAVLRRGRAAERATLLEIIRERALFVFAAVALSGIAVQIIKHVVGRARPGLASKLGAFHFDLFSLKASLASFPSGHSTSIFALATAIGLISPRMRWPVFVLAMTVGLARIILTAHYASDIMAGAMLGVAMTLWVARLFATRSIAFTLTRGLLRLKGRGMILSSLRMQGFCARTGA